uniref:Phytocyanin domain-containing protein n=1 Tax=Setaria italica TaxID=4555 RepID=K3YP40_SETIT
MASRSALIALLVVVSCAAAASAATYTVGETQGWSLGVDYSTWVTGKNFSVGDKLGAYSVLGKLLFTRSASCLLFSSEITHFTVNLFIM